MTQEQISVSRRYIGYRIFTDLWFLGAVWLYFYRLFITDQQVGFLDGMAFAIGLLAEIPSGALADRFGRHRMVRVGIGLVAAGILTQALGSSFAPFFVGQAILMIGMSFLSGADEALFFQNLKFKRQSHHWRRLLTRATQIAMIGGLFATVSGGWLHTIDARIPWILSGLAFATSIFFVWPLKDNRVLASRQKFAAEIKDYLRQIKDGFKQFAKPALRVYLPIILTLQGLFYATGFGLLRMVLLDRFHFDPFWGSVAVASSSLITVGILAYLHKNADDLSEKKVIVTIALSAIAALLLSIADIGLWGYVVILALYAGERVLYPFMSEILNNHAPEDQRATVLSIASFFKVLPYVALGPLIGTLNVHGQLQYFLIGWSLLLAIAIILYLLSGRRDSKVHLAADTV